MSCGLNDDARNLAPYKPSRLRSALLTSAAAIAAFGFTAAPAQAQFTRLFGFGDSYADTGAAPGGAFLLAGRPCIYTPNCTFTGSTTFVQSLQFHYGLPGMVNYAIGGARTDDTNTLTMLPTIAGDVASTTAINPPLPGFSYQLRQLAASGTRFAETDLIALSIGGNDLSGIDVGVSSDHNGVIVAGAVKSAENAVAGIQQMVGLGARTFAWLGTGSSRWFPERTLGKDGPKSFDFTDTQRDLWADTYYQQTQQMLAPMAYAGIRIFLFNFGILQQRVHDNPGLYGFTSAYRCEAGPASPTTPSWVNTNVAGCFYQNSVHPTGTAMALIATYMANQVDAPTTVAPQGRISTSLVTGFAGSVFDRLEASRRFQPFGTGAAMAAMPGSAAAPVTAADRWSIYGNVSYANGNRDRQFYSAGYDYDSVGGNFGVEYLVNSNWRVGGVFGYSQPDVKLGVQDARNRIDAFQFAAYSSYTDAHWFADGLVAYGRHDFALERRGVIDIIRADTSADVFTVAGRGGYLFDLGQLRVGPIAGLNYANVSIQGYTETGDILLTMAVDRQRLDTLTGDAGVQFRYPLQVGRGVYSSFLNLTAAHDFLGSNHIITTTLVTAPLLPILTPVSADGGTYGKVTAGVSALITANVTATLTGTTTFAREGGNDAGVTGGVRLAF